MAVLRRHLFPALVAFCAALSFSIDWNLVDRTGSIDFRNRVTGARLLAAGEDPYHYKWEPGAPAAWCDVYDNRALPITKTTVTPAVLFVTLPVAALPYPAAQKLWLLFEWALLGGIWWLWLRFFPGRATRLLWSAAVVAFTFTLAWRHHIDRGQAYLLWTFLFSLWMTRTLRGPSSPEGERWTGIVAGILFALRPPFFLLLAPFLGLKRRGQLVGAGLGLLAGLAAPIMVHGSAWSDYGKAMRTWSEVYRTDHEPRPGTQAYPPVIEGLPLDQMSRYAVEQYADSSLFRIFRSMGWSPVPAPLVLFALAGLFGAWQWRCRDLPPPRWLAGLACWAFLADFFLPAYRNPYNDIMFLVVVAFLLQSRPLPRVAAGAAAAALVLGWFLIAWKPPSLWLVHLPLLAMLVAVLAVLREVSRPEASGSLPTAA